MKRQSRQSFRPRLESLEGRELPSGAGFFLFLLGGGLQNQVNAVNKDMSNLQGTVQTMTTTQDPNAFTSASRATDANLKQLQTDFTALKNTSQSDNGFLSLAWFSGALDSSDIFFLFSYFGQAQAAANDISSLPGQVAAQGQKTVTLGFVGNVPINAIQASQGLTSPLAIS
jgi:hypothetical protein